MYMYVYLCQNIQIPQNKYLRFGIHYLSEVNEIWLRGREIIIDFLLKMAVYQVFKGVCLIKLFVTFDPHVHVLVWRGHKHVCTCTYLCTVVITALSNIRVTKKDGCIYYVSTLFHTIVTILP